MERDPTVLDDTTMPSLQELTVFLGLAEASTITDVAGELHLSQSQVSRILRRLERKLGTRLFQRSTAGLRRTPEGEIFLGACRSLQRTYVREMQAFRNELSGEAGAVRVAILPSMAYAFLGTWTNAFRAEYPQATVTATDDISGDALASLAAGEADVAISACVLRTPSGRDQALFSETATMEVIPILSERFFLASPPGARLPSRPDWGYAFSQVTLGFTERTSIHRSLSYIARTEGYPYGPETLTNSPLTVAGLVEAKMGSSIVPESNLGLMQIRNITTTPLEGYLRTVCVVSPRGRQAPLVRHFIDTLTRQAPPTPA